MGQLIHFVNYEVIERTHAGGDVIGTTSCGMVASDLIILSQNIQNSTCPECIANNK